MISFLLGLLVLIYGLFGVKGFKIMKYKYEDKGWLKDYEKEMGKRFALTGILWMVLYFVALPTVLNLNMIMVIVLMVVLALPGLFLMKKTEEKYAKRNQAKVEE